MAFWGQDQQEETFGRASDEVISEPTVTCYGSFFEENPEDLFVKGKGKAVP